MVGIISGKASKALDYRIKQLNFDFAVTGCNEKLNEIIKSSSFNLSQIAFVGDDIIDVPIVKKVALSIAPSDAHQLLLGHQILLLQQKISLNPARDLHLCMSL